MSDSRFTPVGDAVLLSDGVGAAVEGAIRSGDLTVGEKLPSEKALCEQFGVSRTVMREALRMLSARGMLRIEKGRGIFVRRVSADSVSNPMELYLHMHSGPDHAVRVVGARRVLEPPIAAEAAMHHTESDAAKLRANVAELRGAAADGPSMSALDLAFHLLIAEAAHNPVLPLLVRPMLMLTTAAEAEAGGAGHDVHAEAVHGHTMILNAILDRDADAARNAMEGHLAVTMENVRASRAQEAIT